MEEFLKINWRTQSFADLEKVKLEFLSEESIAESYVYKKLQTPPPKLATNKKKNAAKKYVPGKILVVQTGKQIPISTVNKWQQNHCLIALKCHQAGKLELNNSEKYSNEIYTGLYQQILDENTKFSELAKTGFNQRRAALTNVKPSIASCMENLWKKSLERSLNYAQFYKEMNTLSLSSSDEDQSVDVQHLQNLLEVGTVARCVLPTLKERFTLQLSTLPVGQSTTVNSKLVVSKDKNINNLIETNEIDVVISAGGLKCLLDVDRGNWNIPVIVRESQAISKTKRTVFIDKPLPSTSPTKTDLNVKCQKSLLRANLCCCKAFSYPAEEVRDQEDVMEAEEDGEKRELFHNVSYRLWSFRPKCDQSELLKSNLKCKNLKVLIRCKLDGCQASDTQTLQPVVIVPHVEYQLAWGGRISTKSELCKNWTSLFFRPYSKMYKARIDCGTCELVQIEPCNLQKINTDAMTHHQYKPHLGLNILYKIFSELVQLETGTYLLRHELKHGSFAAVMKECPTRTSDCFDLHESYKGAKVSNVRISWCPIDVHVVLPMHLACGQMPGLFRGVDRVLKVGKGAKGKKKKKAKGKKKKVAAL